MQRVEQNEADYEIYFWNKNMHVQHTFSPVIRLSTASLMPNIKRFDYNWIYLNQPDTPCLVFIFYKRFVYELFNNVYLFTFSQRQHYNYYTS